MAFSLRKKLVNVYGVETCKLREVDLKYLESFEMWYSRRRKKIERTDWLRNEVLHRIVVERNVLHTIIRRKATLIVHILRRNCLLKHVCEEEIKGRRKMRGRRRKKVNSYWIIIKKWEYPGNLKEKQYIAVCGELAVEVSVDVCTTEYGMNETKKE